MKVESWIVEVLARAHVDGPQLMLTDELARTDYVVIARVIEAAGGKWNRKAGGHVFEGDAAEAIEPVLLTGEVTNKRQELSQFYTPPAVAKRVMQFADIREGLRVLEPSAGRAALAGPAHLQGARVDCVELDPRNVHILASYPFAGLVEGDFLAQDPAAAPLYDAVAMNPPFGKRADIHHVRHAARFLRRGGRLVAIMSAGITFRQDALARGFREWLAGCRNHLIEPLPAGTFRESGTDVSACIVAATI